MANVSTMDTEASVAQAIRMIEAGAEYVRFTAQGEREARNLGVIRRLLNEKGFTTPLVADIHFNPRAADAAAEEVESPDLVLIPDLPLMWESALSEGAECILYESSDRIASDIAERLIEADGNAFEVTYSGRVSVANEEEIARKTADADTVLYLTPASSLRTMRTSSIPAVVDFIHGAALETTAVSGTIGIDWDRTIEGLLSGSDALSYAFFPSKD